MKRIRLQARVVPQPCRYRDTCHGSCDWCKTHDYSEACVPMLQARVQLLQIAAEVTSDALKEKQKECEQKYSLKEIAKAICDSHEECSEACPGWGYCTKGKTGTIDWLREVMK